MSKNSHSDNWKLNLAVYLGMFNMGMIFSITGPLLAPISDFFQLEIAQTGLPVVAITGGFLLATIFMSFLWEIHRVRLLLTLFSALLVLSLMTLAFFHISIEVVLILLFFMGFSQGFLHVAFDTLISEIYERERAKYLSILHLFVGLGAFFSPVLIGIVLSYTSLWYLVYLIVGLINVPLFIIFSNKKLYQGIVVPQKKEVTHKPSLRQPLSSPFLWLIVIVMFLAMGTQVSFTSWLPVFLVRVRHLSPAMASYSVSAFWLTVIIGRGVFSRFLHNTDLTISVILGIILGTLFVGLSFLSTGVIFIILFVACSGLFISIIWPALMAIGANVFPMHIGFLIGILSVSASSSIIFFSWLMGPLSKLLGLNKSVFMIPIMGIGAAVILFYFRYSTKKNTG